MIVEPTKVIPLFLRSFERADRRGRREILERFSSCYKRLVIYKVPNIFGK